MKAFLKVGKSVSFSLDLPQYLQPINRTETLVADADAKLALPKDQMFYALFWFIKTTPLDDIAFNHLIAGRTQQGGRNLAKERNSFITTKPHCMRFDVR